MMEHCGLRYTISYSRFDDGTVAECFINNHKRGNASDVAARDGGILVSLLLQHNCPIETISRALSRNADGSASGVLAAVLDRVAEPQGPEPAE
jgi:hypothetical protein